MDKAGVKKFNAGKVLYGLKDFQLRTVNYVFKRLYGDGENPTNRFLVADEVRLGKTLVAKSIIAKALEHLHDEVERIDIIYVCSNAVIATQSINSLNVSGEQGFEIATRLTMLLTHVKALNDNKVNFVSFTPSMSFNLKSRGGRYEERIIIYRMLRNGCWNVGQGLLNMLQATVKVRESWMDEAENRNMDIYSEIAAKFREKANSDENWSGNFMIVVGDFNGIGKMCRMMNQANAII